MANTFILPISAQTILLAKQEHNDSIEAVMTNFRSTAEPVLANFTIDSNNPSETPRGLLYRSATTHKLYIADDNHQSSLIHSGGYTRAGIGNSIEPSFSQLKANATLGYYEHGELAFVTGNNRVYVKVGTDTDSVYGTDLVDIGISPTNSIVAGQLKSDAVTTVKIIDRAVSNVKIAAATITKYEIAGRGISNSKIEADTISIHEMDESTGGFGNLLTVSSGTGDANVPTGTDLKDTTRAYTKQQTATMVPLGFDGTTTEWDMDAKQTANLYMTGDVTTINMTGHVTGGTYILKIQQGAGGPHTVTNWDASNIVKWPGGDAPVLSTGTSNVDIITLLSDGTDLYGVGSLNLI
jgi:hypothetical protein